MSDLQSRYAQLSHAGAYGSYVPFRTLHDDHATFMDPADVHVDPNALTMHSAYPNTLSAPFAQSAYSMGQTEDDRVYAGRYTDAATGEEYDMWEEAMPEPETDESLQPSNEAMDRMLEQFSGGLNNWDEQKRLGVPQHKPEDNIMISMNDPEDHVRMKFGSWDQIREYEERKARETGRLKMENNFQGMNEKENGPGGSLGLHHMGYTQNYDHAAISGYELSDKGHTGNPTAQVQLPAPWAKPTQYIRNENNLNWHSNGIAGHTFAMRDVNEYPGDRDAHKHADQMANLPPLVNVVLT